MANIERLKHNFVPHLQNGYICCKCGEYCGDWDEVDRVSMSPCVDDDDPCVGKVQELIQTQIAQMWSGFREKETIARGTTMDEAKVDATWPTPVFIPEEKQEFNDWLNSPDPVKVIDWEVE